MWEVVLFRLLAGSWLISEGCSRLQDYFPEYNYIGFLDYPLVFAFSIFTCGYNWVFKTRVTNSPLLEVSSRVFLVFSTRVGIDVFEYLLEWKNLILPRFLNSQPENERFEWTIFFSGCLLVSYSRHPLHIPSPRNRIVNLVLLLAGYLLMKAVRLLYSTLSAYCLVCLIFYNLQVPGVFMVIRGYSWSFSIGASFFFPLMNLDVLDFIIDIGYVSEDYFRLFIGVSYVAVLPFTFFYRVLYWDIVGLFWRCHTQYVGRDVWFVEPGIHLLIGIASFKLLGPARNGVERAFRNIWEELNPCAPAG